MEEYRTWLAAPASNGLVLICFVVLAAMVWWARAAIQKQIASIYRILETALDLEARYLAKRDADNIEPPDQVGSRSFFRTSDGSSSGS